MGALRIYGAWINMPVIVLSFLAVLRFRCSIFQCPLVAAILRLAIMGKMLKERVVFAALFNFIHQRVAYFDGFIKVVRG